MRYRDIDHLVVSHMIITSHMISTLLSCDSDWFGLAESGDGVQRQWGRAAELYLSYR